MAVKIRLARRGRKKQPFYHIVVADTRSPRDGKFIEKIGSYNPMTKPATILLDTDKAFEWLKTGAQPTETARAILRFKGVLYKKHLQRGVSKGAMTQEEADQLFTTFVAEKDAKVAARMEQTRQELLEFHRAVNGTPKKVYTEVVGSTEAMSEFGAAETVTEEAAATEAVEEVAVVAEEATAEVTEVVEEAAVEVVEEAAPEAPVVEEPAAEEPAADAPAEEKE